jgi:lipid II:glycine glycyltransferase (peptidoglycan interpeptide bridge formation enzyme)
LLMQGLAKKWRYNLRKAMTEEYVVQSGTSEELFDRFCAMYEPFRQEKGFEVDLGPSFYAPIQRALPEEERMIVSLAEQNGQLLAGHVFSLLGDTGVNLFRAMTSEGAKTHVSYLLQWNAIVKAVNHRCRFYDMGGIDPDGNPGVYSFKKGVGGEDLTMAGPYEYQPDFLHTMLVRAAEKAYLKWMALKSG